MREGQEAGRSRLFRLPARDELPLPLSPSACLASICEIERRKTHRLGGEEAKVQVCAAVRGRVKVKGKEVRHRAEACFREESHDLECPPPPRTRHASAAMPMRA